MVLHPPFFGTRSIEKVSLETLVSYINRKFLFHVLWKFKGSATAEAEAILRRLILEERQKHLIDAKAVYGYFLCQSVGDELIVYSDAKIEICRFEFPVRSDKPSLARYFQTTSDVVAFQLVTAGQRVIDYANELLARDQYQDYFYWQGLAAAVAESMAEFIHRHIRVELGFVSEEPGSIEEFFQSNQSKYRGERFSFGYPACPNLADQAKVVKLLDVSRIGVKLSESVELVPEYSTSAMIILNPDAKI
ncbi:MAG: vitamin B12 dependent-methionine synthase activation domain-containing protein [Pseudomonadota bacterium]